MPEKLPIAVKVNISGMVQGVGFRPFVYHLSRKFGLTGWVLNDSEGVTVHWEGREEIINGAVGEMVHHPPPQARISRWRSTRVPVFGYGSFSIRHSDAHSDKNVFVSPDIGTCDRCLNEFLDPADRRYLYPFTNCTNCGPRFTIIKDVPYDRPLTTMADFDMCPRCAQEYDNPGDRRFHAQPNACPQCGPRVQVLDAQGKPSNTNIAGILSEGAIVAVKGLGGFHLACNALDREAVAGLRRGKLREGKPFALMADSLQTVRRFCELSAAEEAYLVNPARPIVVLKQRAASNSSLSADINPGLNTLGVMLPYTPLHWLLFSEQLPLLVMTSANLSANPLLISNEEALEKLAGIADYYIVHNRDIEHPCDDSIGTVVDGSWQFIRRARGYVPLPVTVAVGASRPVLACGGNLKNTFALSKGDQVYLSQHWGDLDNQLNFSKYRQGIEKMMDLLGIRPEVIACDAHPQYRSTAFARDLSAGLGLPLVQVQHHHAHMASCMAEHKLCGEVMAVVCDGTGYGTDGAVWGFEFLTGGYASFQRRGHLAYVPLLGGEASIRKPGRMAFSFLYSLYGEELDKQLPRLPLHLSGEELEVLKLQWRTGLNSLPTSSCGRLFDAAAAVLGICRQTLYEGQGPMEMEALAAGAVRAHDYYPVPLVEEADSPFRLQPSALWEQLVEDIKAETKSIPRIAYKFHLSIAYAILNGIKAMAHTTGYKRVVLSGGVFQNKLLTQMVMELLKQEQISCYTQRQVPPNDGGISLGQALVGIEVTDNVSCSTAADN